MAASTRRASCARLSARAEALRRAARRGGRHQHLLRRRHAVADGSLRPSPRSSRRIARALDRRAPMPRSRSRPIRPASRRSAFAGYRAAGVNRVSLGVQALDDASLKSLGRHAHGRRGACRARHRQAQFRARVVRPDLCAAGTDGAAAWRDELDARADPRRRPPLALSAHHRGQARRSPRCTLPALSRIPDGEQAEAFYLLTQELCDAAGLPSYEVSNHARPGPESRHNLLYWRGHDYAGVGPGAHSRITQRRTPKHAHRRPTSPRKPGCKQVAASGHGIEQRRAPERRRTLPTNICSWACASAEGIDRDAAQSHRWAAVSTTRGCSSSRPQGLVKRTPGPAAGDRHRAASCSTG